MGRIMSKLFCKDCTSFHIPHEHAERPEQQAYIFARCSASTYLDPVTGSKRQVLCATERERVSETACGPDGRNFVHILKSA